MDALLAEIRCGHTCAMQQPPGRRPVLQASTRSRLLIVSQAPGRKVEESGIPFDDVSGERLRDWLRIDRATFYAERVAIPRRPYSVSRARARAATCRPPPACTGDLHRRLLALLGQVQLQPRHRAVRAGGHAGRRA
ncbi:uracil-DNA glycosylase family protein [Rhodanobacter lindaniclasticus]